MDDRKKTDEMISRLNQLFNYLGVDHGQNINWIIAHTCIILGGACSLYNRLDHKSGSIVTRSGYNLPKEYRRILPAEGCVCYEETLRHQAGPTIIEDLSRTFYAESDPNIRKFGFKSYLGFPVIFEGESRGSLCILDPKTRRFTSTEINLIAILAKTLSIEEKRWQAQEELKDSEERLKILFEYAPDAYYLSDLNGMLLDGNKAAENLIKVNRQDLIGRNYFDLNLLSADQLPKAAGLLERNIKGEPTGPDEFVLNRSDGGKVNVEIRTFPVKIKGQSIALGITRDITERVRAEAELRASEKRLAQIVDGNAIATFVLDKNHVITHWNRACENLTGFAGAEMVGTRNQWKPFYHRCRPVMADLVIDDAGDEVFRNHYGDGFSRSRVISEGFEAEYFVPALGSGGRWLFFTAAPMRDASGNRIGAMETLQDLTERKAFEHALVQAKHELEEKVRERTINLEEANTALKVLLKTKEDHARMSEERMLSNISKLILPYLDKLKKGSFSEKERIWIEIISNNLADITSPLSQRLASRLMRLTPAEIQVANFIRQGKSTREIAGVLNLSVKTIETHRKNIRAKVGIKSKKTNLRTFLMSIQ
ncbi:MAG: PAS domain S-box protein [Desulfobacterales bacterium]|nr:PAS domain S-box protein [Desulfobacterales bacterium]